MKHCETCVHWADKRENYVKVEIRECKNYEKISDDYYEATSDGLYYSYQEGGTFYTGPKFGCVHHKENT